ncbi:hypothetical protein CDAR_116251 [Caerostris darwini]|uniref:Uncharacterized protein n=1 Tax=Caerostris darwini TaxID=1538125 RepID=A0AAV4V3E3_9ARAC|nr:hypothetical protein CDAR_116251 [Caerostris darwini]
MFPVTSQADQFTFRNRLTNHRTSAFSESNTASQRNSMHTHVSANASSKASGKKFPDIRRKGYHLSVGCQIQASLSNPATSYRINASLYPDTTNSMQRSSHQYLLVLNRWLLIIRLGMGM